VRVATAASTRSTTATSSELLSETSGNRRSDATWLASKRSPPAIKKTAPARKAMRSAARSIEMRFVARAGRCCISQLTIGYDCNSQLTISQPNVTIDNQVPPTRRLSADAMPVEFLRQSGPEAEEAV
jgi:hypothetical protein